MYFFFRIHFQFKSTTYPHKIIAYVGDDPKGTVIGQRTAASKSDPFVAPVSPLPTTFPIKVKVEVNDRQKGYVFLSPIELIIGMIFKKKS